MDTPITLDFETMPIGPNDPYPRPVGLAVWEPGERPRYLAFGHPVRNNCSQVEAIELWQYALDSGRHLLFHNAIFDLGVAETHWQMEIPWDRVLDSQVAAFLLDPLAKGRGLKDLAQEMLGMDPDEQYDLYDWIHAHVPQARGLRKRSPKLGAFIGYAPGDLVGRYAKGDVFRTRKLWDHALEHFDRGLGDACNRELDLLPVLKQMSDRGVPADLAAVEKELPVWERGLEVADDWVRRRLGAPGLELNRRTKLADAMESAGVVTEWFETPTGERDTSFRSLRVQVAEGTLSDAPLAEVLAWRSQMAHLLRTWARVWVAHGEHGAVRHAWRGTVQEQGGARTGRLASSPNAQNHAKVPYEVVTRKADLATVARPILLPKALAAKLPPLPSPRHYVKAPPRQTLVGADYSQQELRVFAQYAGGAVLDLYQKDPKLDFHQMVAELVGITRTEAKAVNFAKLYGAGIGKTAEQVGCSLARSKEIRSQWDDAIPGGAALQAALEDQARRHGFFRTWGGRAYPIPPDRRYVAINYLVQGSSADMTKVAMLRAHDLGLDLRLSVHDELVCLAPTADVKGTKAKLVTAMDVPHWEVPLVIDPYHRKRWSN